MVLARPLPRTRTQVTAISANDITLAAAPELGMQSMISKLPNGTQSTFMLAKNTGPEIVWERFIGTKTDNKISRDLPLSNSDGLPTPQTFPLTGTAVVWMDPHEDFIAFLNIANTFTEDTFHRGKLGFGPTDATWWEASYSALDGHAASLRLGGAVHSVFEPGSYEIATASDTVDYSPEITITRTRTNAGNGSQGGRLVFQQSDNGANETGQIQTQRIASIEAFWRNFTGSAKSSLNLRVMNSGAMTTHLTIAGGNGVQVRGTSLLVGKTTMGDFAGVGTEITATGQILSVADGVAPYKANRLTSDGEMFEFWRGNANPGNITANSTTVTYGAFVGVHPSSFPDDEPDVGDFLEAGTVLIHVADMDRHEPQPHLPKSRISRVEEDPRAYGVFEEWLHPRSHTEDGEPVWDPTRKEGSFDVAGLGIPGKGVRVVGPVRAGDRLVTSSFPGHAKAWRWSWRRPLRLWPRAGAVFAYCFDDDPRTEPRAVCASLQKG